MTENPVSLSDHLDPHRRKTTSRPTNEKPAGITKKGKTSFSCHRCRSLGYLSMDLPREDPNFGKLVPCPDCGTHSKRLAAASGLEGVETRLTWKNLLEDGNARQAAEVVQEIIERGHGWVYLHGGYGIAKTVLLKIAVAETIRTGTVAAYANMADIVDHMRQAYDHEYPNNESAGRLNRWAEIKLLAIDEFDRLRETEYSSEKRFQLMDRRYVSAGREQTITLMASNRPPEVFDGYLTSRIRDGRFTVLEVTGEDMRPGLDWTHEI